MRGAARRAVVSRRPAGAEAIVRCRGPARCAHRGRAWFARIGTRAPEGAQRLARGEPRLADVRDCTVERRRCAAGHVRPNRKAATRRARRRRVDAPEAMRDSDIEPTGRERAEHGFAAVLVGHAHLAQTFRARRSLGAVAISHIAHPAITGARVADAALDAHALSARREPVDVRAVRVVDACAAEVVDPAAARRAVRALRRDRARTAAVLHAERSDGGAIAICGAANATPRGRVTDVVARAVRVLCAGDAARERLAPERICGASAIRVDFGIGDGRRAVPATYEAERQREPRDSRRQARHR